MVGLWRYWGKRGQVVVKGVVDSMISPFEATLIGILEYQPATRYEVMKAIQSQSLYWAGSPGAVYSALGRMLRKGLLEEVVSTDPKAYKITALGIEVGHDFLITPAPAAKLVLDPSLVRMKLRGLQEFSAADRIGFYQMQLEEYSKAEQLVTDRQMGYAGRKIGRDLSELALEQLELEENLIRKLLAEEIEETTNQ